MKTTVPIIIDVKPFLAKAEKLADEFQYLLPNDNDSLRLGKKIKKLVSEAYETGLHNGASNPYA